jgi:hypothetical protein
MDQPNLPKHILDRVERRWSTVLSQQAARANLARFQMVPARLGRASGSGRKRPKQGRPNGGAIFSLHL